MADLQAGQFREFFRQLHGKQPFPWQEALAVRVCAGEWPEVIDLPTASGKTACIDVALFALAVRGKEAARRIFFVVDRRVVVSEAYLRVRDVRDKLAKANNGVLYEVAERLRMLGRGNRTGGTENEDDLLLVSEMRGGAFRDESWIRNPLQPTVIASTVDQVGSRLLFRGYGVNENSWPLHAGLIGNDALIFLDEAHCSRAFAQTLQRIECYRGEQWASDPLPSPFHFVQMTATPSAQKASAGFFALTDDDRNVDTLKKRLQAVKPTRLIEVKGKKDDTAKLVDALVSHAIELAKTTDARRVVVFANRVKTAKQTYQHLQQGVEGGEARVELVIGSMRAVDRDDIYENKLKKLKSDVPRNVDDPLTFVVSTQCLEVGADLDFDVLVSECASIDALQQRFGRLDRLGEFGRARGAIVIGSWQTNAKEPDAVYGETLSRTWEWLEGLAGEIGEVNMGIESRAGEPFTVHERLNISGETGLRLVGEDAPVLLPTHVDMLAQTSPVPEPSPLVELFLHGPKRGVPDVQIVWRSDLEDARPEEEIDIVKLCPPSSRETMPVSIAAFRKWFAGAKNVNDKESDLESGVEEGEIGQQRNIHVLAWNGDKSEIIQNVDKIRPGQTLVLRASLQGWDELGYIPERATVDVGDRAALEARKSVSLRLHPELMKKWPEAPALHLLTEYLRRADVELDEVKKHLETYREELEKEPVEGQKPWPYGFLSKLELGELRRTQLDAYPYTGQKISYALRARQGKGRQSNREPVFLEDHLADVEKAVSAMCPNLRGDFQEALVRSAKLHDYGKADVRFQAWLRGGDRLAARFAPKEIAKSGNDVLQKQKTVGLPEGFRHELLSLMFAEKSPEACGQMRDLILHLVAAHHGWCRPFPPVVPDEGAECASYGGIAVCKEERLEKAPHRLDSGVADRFWRLTAKYGWWGLAYLEAILRLADWQASGREAAEVSD